MPSRRFRCALALGVLASVVAAASVARAQELPPTDEPPPDLFGEGEKAASAAGAPDTDYTPVAKDTPLWERVHGAIFPEDRVPDSSITDFRDSLYDVAFLNTNLGYAGGARRLDCGGTPTDVPVMYRYGDVGGTGLAWRLDFVGDCDDRGFVGAIAWVAGSGRAVAVGGTGSYPHREPAYRPECQRLETDPETGIEENADAYGVRCDEAGDARAWHLADAGWNEITDELPTARGGEQPRGMTALDFSPTGEVGYAGGLGQIWRWQGAGFDQLYDVHSPCPRASFTQLAPGVEVPGGAPHAQCEFANADRFRFRVRELRFASIDPPLAFAVTDGCCAEDRLRNTPALLTYGRNGTSDTPRWYAGSLDPLSSLAFDDGSGSFSNPATREGAKRRVNTRQEMPDSFYSLTIGRDTTSALGTRLSVIAAPAAPEGTEPERSLITQPYCVSFTGRHSAGFSFSGVGIEEQTNVPDQLVEAMRARLSSVRLVAGDGDTATSFTRLDRPDRSWGHAGRRVAARGAHGHNGRQYDL